MRKQHRNQLYFTICTVCNCLFYPRSKKTSECSARCKRKAKAAKAMETMGVSDNGMTLAQQAKNQPKRKGSK